MGSRKGRILLKLLAVQRGSPVPIDTIVETLWADDPPAKARENVSSLVSRLRSLLGPGAIESVGDGYRLLGAAVSVDLDEAAALVEEAAARLSDGEPTVAVAAAERAGELLARGAVLEDEPYAEWATDTRSRAARLLRSARETAWLAGLAIGDADAVVRAATAAIDADLLDEEAYRALMLGHRLSGRTAAALGTFERLRDVLAEELGADPSPETRAVHVGILRDEPPPPAPVQPARAAPRAHEPGFFGRDAELARVSEAWTKAVAGSPTMLLVAGEAGIGKTRLAAEIEAEAGRTGAHVLSARCYEAERSVFLQPVLDAVRTMVVSTPPDVLRALAGEWAGTLADLLPEIGLVLRPIGYTRATPEVEHRRAFGSLAAFVRRIARRAPALLYLDDLHNAGSSTLEFLHFFARRLAGDRVLVLATVRADEGADAFGTLGDVATRLDLRPLGDDAVHQLATAMGASPEVASEVLRRTRGHTFFVIEALRAAAEADPSRTSVVPDTLREAVVTRARRLGPGCEDLLRAAATLGPAFDLPTVAQLADVPVEEAAANAERALRAGLLAEAGSSYEFANDLIQEVLYATTPGPTRAARHRRAATLLGGNPEVVAMHAAAAGEWALACRAWRDAAQRAARRFANRDAVRMLDLALDAARATGDQRAEAGTLHERGRVLEMLGEWSGSYADHIRAVDLAREVGDLHTEMRSLRELGGDVEVARGGSTAACVEPLLAALAIAERIGDPRMRISCLTRLCVCRSNMLRFDEGVADGERALDVARSSGDDLDLALALDGLKMAASYMGDVERLASLTSELEPILRRHGELVLLMWTLLESAVGPLSAARFDETVTILRAAADLARRSGDPRVGALVPAVWAWVERARGSYAGAIRLAEEGARMGDDFRHPWGIGFGHAMLSWIWTELGQPDLAVEHGERAVAGAERDGVENWLVRAEAHLAWAAWVAGRSDLAATFVDRAEATLDRVRTPAGLAFLHGGHAYVAAARVRLGQERHDRVAALLAPLLAVAESTPWMEVVVDASIVLGRSWEALASNRDAARLLARAADLAERHGLARATWEANASLATVLRATGRPGDASTRERRALDAIARAASSLEDSELRATFRRGALDALGLVPLSEPDLP